MSQLLAIVFLLGLALGLLAGWYGWSRHGARWSERSLVEDALKHLYDCEYRRHAASVESLAGALDVDANRAARLVSKMGSMGLLQSQESGPELTPEGRRYALRMVRTHRLWEHYLAEQTGLAEGEWHEDADLREHRLSAEEVDALAAAMGHPRYDPHGDPIPTSEGEVPPARGQALNTLSAGDSALVIHVEDEPGTVYEQLTAQGLSRGVKMRVMEKSSERICIEVDGHEHFLAPVVAANLSVEKLSQPDVAEERSRRLSDLKLGDQATVLSLLPACRGAQRRRLLDLGLLPGTVVEAELQSPSGEPTAYRIRDALIALRKEQTELIRVKMLEPVTDSSS